MHMRLTLGVVAVSFAAGVLAMIGSGPASAESTWELINRTGKLRSAVLDSPPYWWREGGKWKGAMITMSEDIAKNLGVQLELVEVGGWGQTVLNLTGGHTDMSFSMQATPVRAKAIDFAGPAYYIASTAINADKFHGKTWDEFNKPEVTVAVELGSASETILRKQAPKSKVLGLTTLSEALLTVKSGRADAFVTTSMIALISNGTNPDLGEVITPTPVVALPGYIGVRQDVGDTRFRDFLNWWCEWNRLLGINERLLKEALTERGLKDIPEHVHF